MAQYLVEVGYTADSWAHQIRNQGNVLDRIQPLIDACGGRIDSAFYAFGDRDFVAIADFPSPEEAAAFSLACSAGGSVRSILTTPLLTIDQGLTAMRRAHDASASYRPPVDAPSSQRQ